MTANKTTPPPTYLDGKPINLEAAAIDALEWLKLFRSYGRVNLEADGGNRLKLKTAIASPEFGDAISSLEKFLPPVREE